LKARDLVYYNVKGNVSSHLSRHMFCGTSMPVLKITLPFKTFLYTVYLIIVFIFICYVIYVQFTYFLLWCTPFYRNCIRTLFEETKLGGLVLAAV
jgi:hypothetical protein